jgi:hypothetical protein
MPSANDHIGISDSIGPRPVVIQGMPAEIKLSAPVGTLTIEDTTDVNIFDGTITKKVRITPLGDSGFLARVDNTFIGVGDNRDDTYLGIVDDLMPPDDQE